MDNRVFNVNGSSGNETLLLKTLELVFVQEGRECKALAYKVSDKGFVLSWHKKTEPGWQLTPGPMSAKDCLPLVAAYLKSDEAKACEPGPWDRDADHDGDNGPGWRVFVEDWGHVGNEFSIICAIKPAFMWYGK